MAGGYVVRDANGQELAYIYARANEAEAREAKVLTADEARRNPANIARLSLSPLRARSLTPFTPSNIKRKIYMCSARPPRSAVTASWTSESCSTSILPILEREPGSHTGGRTRPKRVWRWCSGVDARRLPIRSGARSEDRMNERQDTRRGIRGVRAQNVSLFAAQVMSNRTALDARRLAWKGRLRRGGGDAAQVC
jgi:hypothetical protein